MKKLNEAELYVIRDRAIKALAAELRAAVNFPTDRETYQLCGLDPQLEARNPFAWS